MKGVILTDNTNYLGFDRNISLWGQYSFQYPIVDDYFVEAKYLECLLKEKKSFMKNNLYLLYFSEDNCKYLDFKQIGVDCGYLYEPNDDFYIGFSIIYNEILRMNNSFCVEYRKQLNEYSLFSSAEQAKSFLQERAFFCDKYKFENAFQKLSIVNIYIQIDYGLF